MKKVATHSGTFHADEVFAVATIEIALANPIELIRTRDREIYKDADICIDIGGEYDDTRDRFDHHQAKGAGKRSNGIPYASFGLVWKKYGLIICGNQSIVDEIDEEIVQPIDAEDNGMEFVKLTKSHIRPFAVPDVVHILNSTWKESDRNQDEAFGEALKLAKFILHRAILRARDKHEAERFVTTAYESAEDKRVIITDSHYPDRDVLCKFLEPLFVVRPNSDGTWGAETIKDDPRSFKNRKDFPKKWGGKTGSALEKASGVTGALFCHRNLFLVIGATKEAALELVERALNQ
jgi:uncharacterized UPF0160 family protein